MKSTATFIQADPATKPLMILEGLQFISSEISTAAKSLEVLNGWIELMPSLLEFQKAEGIDLKQLTERLSQFTLNADDLTDQIVRNSEKISELMLQLKQK